MAHGHTSPDTNRHGKGGGRRELLKWSQDTYLVAEHVVLVDPDGAGAEVVADADGGVEIPSVHGGGETVCAVVAGLDDLVLGRELGDGADGAEDFLLHDLHVGGDVAEDGRLDEVALVAVALTTSLAGGTGLLALLDVVHDAVVLQLADLGTLEGVGVEGVTDSVLLSSLLEGGDELVVDTLLDVDTRASTAALSVVEVNTEVDPRDGLLDIGVVEDDVGRLSTELQGDLLQVRGGSSLHDSASNQGRASEGDLVDVHVGGQGSTGGLAETGDDVENTRGEASLLDEVGEHKSRQRCLLSRLHDDCVTRAQSRANLPGEHEQREVPGDDLGANTNL